jgi:hypothetical protein
MISARGRRLTSDKIAEAVAEQLRATSLLLDVVAARSADPAWRDLAELLERVATVLRTPARLPADVRSRIAAVEAVLPLREITPLR